jgi:hypothetical protein
LFSNLIFYVLIFAFTRGVRALIPHFETKECEFGLSAVIPEGERTLFTESHSEAFFLRLLELGSL